MDPSENSAEMNAGLDTGAVYLKPILKANI